MIANNEPALQRLIDQVLAAREAVQPLDIRGGGTKDFYGGSRQGEPLDVRPLAGTDPSQQFRSRTGVVARPPQAVTDPPGERRCAFIGLVRWMRADESDIVSQLPHRA